MHKINILWYSPTCLFLPIIEELEMIGHSIEIINNSAEAKNANYDIVIHDALVEKDLVPAKHTISIQQSCQINNSNSKLPKGFVIRVFNEDNTFLFLRAEELSDQYIVQELFIDFFLEYSRTEKLSTVNDLYKKEIYEQIKWIYEGKSKDLNAESIISIFLEQASMYPNKIAIEDNYRSVTYHELEDIVINTSIFLMRQYPHLKGKAIAIGGERKIDIVATILSILNVGAYYVPLDKNYPSGRIISILDSANPELIITDNYFLDQHQKTLNNYPVLNIGAISKLEKSLDKKTQDLHNSNISSNTLCYVIFTSGSTGVPKGVMVEHGSIINLAKSSYSACSYDKNSRLLSVASIGFDAFGWDIYGALLNGLTVIIAPEQIQTDPNALADFIVQNNITIATLTPAVLSVMPSNITNNLDCLIVMGDKVQKSLMNRMVKNVKLFNGYGPTETTIGASIGEYKFGGAINNIGKPLNNYHFFIVDRNMQILPRGFAGELCIVGVGVSRGYFNDPQKTDAHFTDFKINGHTIRAYKTGDIVRQIENEYEFIGRKDFQIKVRGVRIEIEEIENILQQLDIIGNCVVSFKDSELKAYIQFEDQIDPEEINIDILVNHLSRFLHPAAIPSMFYQVISFNLTTNGKIDRKNIVIDKEIKLKKFIAPRNLQEELIFNIFSEVLKRSDFGINDNFFLLGGHSLTAASVIAQINEFFEISLPVHTIFDKSTICELANEVTDADSKTTYLEKSVVRKGALTFAQERLWYLYQLDSQDVSYNLPYAIQIKGRLDLAILEKSIRIIINRHESFKTIFKGGKKSSQVVDEKLDVPYSVIKNCVDPNSYINAFCYKAFDLENESPVRIALLKVNTNINLLVFAVHNIVTDAWSFGIIVKELFHIYNKLYNNEPLKLEKLEFQIIDVGNYEKKYKNKQNLKKQISYWKEKLLNYKRLDFQSNPRPEILKNDGDTKNYIFNSKAWCKIKEHAKNSGCTPFSSLMSIMNIWFAKYSNQTDIILGTALASRYGVEMEKMTGFFVNTIPLRTIFSSEDNFHNVLLKTQKSCIEAIANQDVPFEWIVEVSSTKRRLNMNPLFQIMIILQNADETELPISAGLELSHYRVSSQYAMFDMVWNFKENGEQLLVDLSYNSTLYSTEMIDEYLLNLDYFISNLSVNIDRQIKDLPLVSPELYKKILENAKGSKQLLQTNTLLEKILENFRYSPEDIAVIDENGKYSYIDLAKKSYKIASYINSNFSPNNIGIGIQINRTFEMVSSILGILFSGNYYVPLDPYYPKDRREYIASNSQVQGIIIDEECNFFDGIRKINLQAIDSVSTHKFSIEDLYSIVKNISSKDLAYVLYTSGTTGLPKGVMITHENINNLCEYFCTTIDLTKESHFLSITTISFDIFALEVFCPLMIGSTLHIVSTDTARNPVKLVNLISDITPSHMQATPTLWRTIIDHVNQESMLVLCGGEALDYGLYQKIKQKFTRAYNVYGPTETTVWSTCSNMHDNDYVSIGKPIQNTQCYVLDAQQNICPPNVWGELVIAGDGLGNGYINNHELTEKSFREIIVNNETVRIYKTGDRAKFTSDGEIICSGRFDSQIKLRGNRIEISEIEEAINAVEFVKMSAVKLWGEHNSAYLCAYVVLNDETNRDNNIVTILKEHLEKMVPPIMVPAKILIADELPRTNNGKINRKVLVEPADRSIVSDKKSVIPSTKHEKEISKIWSEVLNVNMVSIHDNFFMVGGNSIHIPQIVHILNQSYQVDLTIRDFILNSTIYELSLFIQNKIKVELV